ncbi:MAG: cation transporter [Steroidobacteraceae bacterium]
MHRSPVIKASVLFKSLGLIIALVGLAPLAYSDGLTRVEQTIFGMDCAPCAYGIEHGLKRLSDVTDVRVSLNAGVAIVALTPGSTTTIENIRKVIRDNGFTPKAALVVVTGTLVRVDGHTWLEASGLPRYQLTGVTKEIEAMRNARPSGEVQLEGEVPESDSTARELFVKSLTG